MAGVKVISKINTGGFRKVSALFSWIYNRNFLSGLCKKDKDRYEKRVVRSKGINR